jgi:predicted nucleic acid-binding protein
VSSVFTDTSALVKYYYPEEGSEEVEGILLEAERVYLCQVAAAEFASALMKKVRIGAVIPLDDRHYQKAVEIIRGFGQREGIRALDSLQLASALDVHDAKFLSADRLLTGLALKMGFKVLRI